MDHGISLINFTKKFPNCLEVNCKFQKISNVVVFENIDVEYFQIQY